MFHALLEENIAYRTCGDNRVGMLTVLYIRFGVLMCLKIKTRMNMLRITRLLYFARLLVS